MQAMNSLDRSSRSRAWGRWARCGSSPTPTRSRPPVRAAHGRAALRPDRARRRGRRRSASGRSSSGWRRGSPSAGRCCVRLRERVLARRTGRRGVSCRSTRALLLDDRHDCLAGLRGRARRGARSAGDPGRAVLRRARARPAGALDRPRACAARRRQQLSSARRSAASPRHGLVASLAPKPWPDNAGNGCHIHFSLWEDGRNRFYDAAAATLSDEARASSRGVLAHLPGLCGAHRAELQLLPAHRPRRTWSGAYACWATTTARRRSGVPPFPRPRGGVDERRAQGRRRELQPVPRRSAG